MRPKLVRIVTLLAGLAAVAAASTEATAHMPDPLPSRYTMWAAWNALNGDPYELDAIPRRLENRRARVACAREGLVQHPGSAVRYYGAVLVNESFRERLVRFEEVVAEVARETYGRAPRRIRHLGAFSCRKSRTRSHMVSEHALGNAIDVLGFDFGPAPKGEPLPEGLPKTLRGPFQVRVERHWNKTSSPTVELHARFLRTLTDRLAERRDIFRSMFGPAHRGHSNHFHFDVSPWRYVHL